MDNKKENKNKTIFTFTVSAATIAITNCRQSFSLLAIKIIIANLGETGILESDFPIEVITANVPSVKIHRNF